ncbi:optineurin-like isoform X2 [Neocloeon triangulifer]|uniref:optineurin-like isoform X2 n=1 Tax=Neocloeon triangulifer TaxID=2078957 RepID=UPI00286EBF7E|nr:optineurin-like isoform X2 [Neocloeon triangulifer]
MVKPNAGSLSRTGSSVGQDNSRGRSSGPPSSNTDDLSFVVIDSQSPQSHGSNGCPSSLNGNSLMPSMPSLSSPNNSLASSLQSNAEELNMQLQEVLKDKIELRETLRQNNLAMKQHFATVETWQDEVQGVLLSHKTKFEEMKSIILKLKNENKSLTAKVVDQPKFDETLKENEDLKNKLHDVERKLSNHQALMKENASLKDHIAELEQKIAGGMLATEAQERAELRLRELSEERVMWLRDKEELQNRVILLQEELTSVHADGFVVLNSETQRETNPEEKKQLLGPQEKLNNFYAAMDKYEEKLMASYKTLESQVDSFAAVYNWLDETRSKLPCSSSSLSEVGTLMEMVSLSLREAQNSSTGHRLRLEEASQQLGRLSSDFQGLLQEYLALSNELKNNKDLCQQTVQSNELQGKVDHLSSQLLDAREKLTLKEKSLTQLNVTLAKKEAEITHLALEMQKKSNEPSQEMKEQLDHMTAQMFEMKDILEQKDRNLEKQNSTIAVKDAKLAQMELRVSQAETKATQKETEVLTMQKKLQSVEQSADALKAQAEVYKMDFDEERESREKLAADKEKIADELRAAQQENQRLTAEMQALKSSQSQPSIVPSAPSVTPNTSTSRPQAHNYNTIATPGRSRGSWLTDSFESGDQREQPKYECPFCKLVFKSLHPLENHVEFCVNVEMFP